MRKTVRKCIITGASGLIGTQVLEVLRDEWKVFSVTRRKAGKQNRNIEFIKLDLSRKWSADVLPRKVDAVIYLAQSGHFRDFPDHGINIFNVNTLSVLKFLEYARKAKVRTFILASSGGVESLNLNINRDMENGLKFYLSTKLCAEILAKQYARFFNVIILRFFFVYGPGQRKDMLIPRLVSRVKERQPIMLDGHNGIKINPTHVSDAARAVKKAIGLRGSHTIDIAGPKVYTIRKISGIIGERLSKSPVYKVRRGAVSRDIKGNIRAMARLLDAPSVTFEEGVKSIL